MTPSVEVWAFFQTLIGRVAYLFPALNIGSKSWQRI